MSAIRSFIIVFMVCFTSLPGIVFAEEPLRIEPSEIVSIFDEHQETLPVITSLDVDPSGKILAIGGDNHKVRLWNVDTKRSQREIRDQLDWIRGIAFSDNQKHFVVVAQDGRMEVRNLQAGAISRQIQSKNRGIQSVAFRPGGQEFAVCGFCNTIPVYNAFSGELVRTLRAHGTNNRAIRFSQDGSLLAVAGRTGVVRIWNVDTGEALKEISGDGRRVNALVFNSDGTKIAIGGDGPHITVWSVVNGKCLTVLPERAGKTYSLEFCGENILASGESDNVIRFWNLKTQSYYADTAGPNGHTGTIATLVFDPQKAILISGSFDTTVRFWTVP